MDHREMLELRDPPVTWDLPDLPDPVDLVEMLVTALTAQLLEQHLDIKLNLR